MTEHTYSAPRTLPEGVLEHGFSIERAPHVEGYGELIPMGNIFASREEQAQDLLRRIAAKDGVRILNEGEEPNPDERLYTSAVLTKVSQTEYDKQVSEGKLVSNVDDPGTPYAYTRRSMDAEYAEKVGLRNVYRDREQQELLRTVSRTAMQQYDADYMKIPDYGFEKVEGVSQIFELSAWGHKRMLYNLTGTLVTDRQLAKILNAIREQCDLTGGAAIENLGVMAILPESSSTWGKGTTGKTHYGTVMLNERVFKDDHMDEVGSPKDSYPVGGGELETLVFHEMSHIVIDSVDPKVQREAAQKVGWKLSDSPLLNHDGHILPGFISVPSDYSRENAAEHLAEIPTAQYAGEEWAHAVDAAQRLAVEGLYEAQHSGMQGPTYVRCKEVDLRNLPKKLGFELMDGKNVAIRPDVSYEITRT